MVQQDPELPLLGEPLLVELANSLYVTPEVRFDALACPESARAWLEAAVPSHAPHDLAIEEFLDFRSLRDALVAVFDHREGDPAPQDAVRTLNELASHPPHLVWEDDAEPRLTVEGSAFRRFLLDTSRLAIVWTVGRERHTVHVCGRPECPMRFVRREARRRYCGARCASAHRQARYNQRRRVAGRAEAAGSPKAGVSSVETSDPTHGKRNSSP